MFHCSVLNKWQANVLKDNVDCTNVNQTLISVPEDAGVLSHFYELVSKVTNSVPRGNSVPIVRPRHYIVREELMPPRVVLQ